MSARLDLRALSRDYGAGTGPALREVHLGVPAGSCVAVLGPSGSGKTTLLRLASGLESPDSGDVLVDGSRVTGVAPEERGMAMVFQRPLLFPHRDVLDNVAFAGRVRGLSRRRARLEAADYLALVQLSELGRRRPDELSGGQAQRVALARALAARPRVLLLDEAFSGLDAPLREEMYALLRRVRSALHPTILLVTHEHTEAAALADSVAVLSCGELVQHDSVERLYTRPASLVVARQLGGRNEVPGVVEGHHHRSALGRLTLPVDVRPRPGAGLLVFRQESVRVEHPESASADVVGRVVTVQPQGPRRLLGVEIGSGTERPSSGVIVHAETAPGHRTDVGDRVGLHLPPHALTVVPTEDPDTLGRSPRGRLERARPVAGPTADEESLPDTEARAAP
jgi:putative spermidine/putrescine transport system ATP-binding protein